MDKWVDDAREGRARGFDELYRAHSRAISAFARARGAADPEGICNEAFLRAFRALPTFEGDAAAFRRWLFSITRNLLIEIGTEELPPKALRGLMDAFAGNLGAGLDAARLEHGEIHAYASPRRLAR